MNFRDRYKRALTEKGGFTIIPNILLTGEHWEVNGKPMEFRQRALLVSLLSLDFRGGWFKAGRRVLKKSGLGTNSIALAEKELVEAGLLQVRAELNCVNEYNLDGFYRRFLNVETAPSPEGEPPPRKRELARDVQALLDAEGVAGSK